MRGSEPPDSRAREPYEWAGLEGASRSALCTCTKSRAGCSAPALHPLCIPPHELSATTSRQGIHDEQLRWMLQLRIFVRLNSNTTKSTLRSNVWCAHLLAEWFND
jgi:hypothetical protein